MRNVILHHGFGWWMGLILHFNIDICILSHVLNYGNDQTKWGNTRFIRLFFTICHFSFLSYFLLRPFPVLSASLSFKLHDHFPFGRRCSVAVVVIVAVSQRIHSLPFQAGQQKKAWLDKCSEHAKCFFSNGTRNHDGKYTWCYNSHYTSRMQKTTWAHTKYTHALWTHSVGTQKRQHV